MNKKIDIKDFLDQKSIRLIEKLAKVEGMDKNDDSRKFAEIIKISLEEKYARFNREYVSMRLD